MMRFDCENDTGGYHTLFSAFEGYNARMTWEGTVHEVTIRDSDRNGVRVQLWRLYDTDEGHGELVDLGYDNIEELVIY